MKNLLTCSIALLVFALSACTSTASSGYQRQVAGGHRVVPCKSVAPTGSRIKTHVECEGRGGNNRYEVRTWSDIEKDRAY